MNDYNILNLSPFRYVTNGKFKNIPFVIANDYFHSLYIIVDGIHPNLSRFMKGIKQLISQTEMKYKKWQKGVQKDIERAFGVLKFTLRFLQKP